MKIQFKTDKAASEEKFHQRIKDILDDIRYKIALGQTSGAIEVNGKKIGKWKL